MSNDSTKHIVSQSGLSVAGRSYFAFSHLFKKKPRATARTLLGQFLLVAVGILLGVKSSPAQINSRIDLLIEEGAEFQPGSFVGSLGIPSISKGNYLFGGGWDLAVTGALGSGGNSSDHVMFFTDSDTARFQYNGDGVSSIVDDRPSSAFDNTGPAYLDLNGGPVDVYSGTTLLPTTSTGTIFSGRPSAWSDVITHYEFGAQSGSSPDSKIVSRMGGTDSTLVSASNNGFDEIGMLGLGFRNDISFGRGGGMRVVFRGHDNHVPHTQLDTKNGIFVKDMASGALTTVVDNVPLGHNYTHPFVPGDPLETVLPVAHGQGAAWTYRDQAVYARPVLGSTGQVHVIDDDPAYRYGNVSSGGGGMLFYEKTPKNGTEADKTQIWMNLMGQNMLCVDRSMIPGVPVLDLSIGSEAFARDLLTLNTQNSTITYHALAFHAARLNPVPEEAIYVKSMSQTGIDVGGGFNGARVDVNHPGEIAYFTVGNGGCAECQPTDRDFLMMVAHNSTGEDLPLAQNYGVSLGVDSGGADDPFLLNSFQQGGELVSEGASIDLCIDIIFNTLLFTDLDPSEVVRIGVDGAFTEIVYEGVGQDQFIDGIQGIVLDPPITLPAGSVLTIEHGGNGDGFGLSSFILSPANVDCYRHDDGESENYVGQAATGDFLWGNYFNEIPGGSTITSVSLAFSEVGVPVGSEFQVAIYEDLDDDGDPRTNSQLVASASGTVDNPGPVGSDMFQMVDIPDVTISGGFFVAAFMEGTPNNPYPAKLDMTNSLRQSWFAEHEEIGQLDIADPFGSATLSGLIDDFELPGNFLIRAQCSDAQTCNPGDVNQDGSIDLLDVGPFIDAVSTGAFVCEADVNGDGTVDLLDVSPFVALLAGG